MFFLSRRVMAACLAAAPILLLAAPRVAHAEEVVAVTTSALGGSGATVFTFDSADPSKTSTPINITGITGEIQGIDFRPTEGGALYLLTRPSRFTGNLYTLDPTTGVATFVAPITQLFNGQPITDILAFGETGTIDFNPVTGTLNYLTLSTNGFLQVAINPDTGLSSIIGQTPFGPPSAGPFQSGLAFSNNDNDPATGTTAYSIDTIGNRLTILPPGTANPQVVGSGLGIDPGFGMTAELDFSGSGTLYGAIALQSGGGTRFFTIDPVTGLASSALTGGANNLINSGSNPFVRGIAVRPNVAVVPEPDATAVFGVAVLLGGVGVIAGRRRRRNSGVPAIPV